MGSTSKNILHKRSAEAVFAGRFHLGANFVTKFMKLEIRANYFVLEFYDISEMSLKKKIHYNLANDSKM